jgi:hypothetical protein
MRCAAAPCGALCRDHILILEDALPDGCKHLLFTHTVAQ